MPNVGLTNLTAGEVSPSFLGRADVARYPNACQRLENFLLTTTGMYSKRPGFGLMGLPKNSAGLVALRRFQFSDQQGNIIELGDMYARIWNTAGQVLDPSSGQPVEVATPFPDGELGLIGYTQSADFLFMMHEQRGIFTIKRLSLTNWQFGSFPLSDGPYGAENAIQTKTLSFSGTNGNVTVTAAGFTADPEGGAPWAEGDEYGGIMRVRDGTDGSGNPRWTWLLITQFIDASHVKANVVGSTDNATSGAFATLMAATPYYDFRLGIYSNRLGWPKTGRIHEQRLVLAGPASLPDRLDGSKIAGFNVFAPTDPLVADGAYAYALGTEGVNRILGMIASNDLVLLTAGAEHHVAGDSTGAAITPSAIWQKPISPDGAKAGIEPVQAQNATVFIDKYGLNVRALAFDFRFQNYAPDNLTEIADHMCWLDPSSPGFQDLKWQGNPFGTIWTRRGNNELAGAIYNPLQNVLGWHRHPMGSAAGEVPQVESIETLKGPTHDELWAVVRRDLPSGTLRTIERMGRPGLWDTPYQRQSWLDSSLSIRNCPTADLAPAAIAGNAIVFNLVNVTAGYVLPAGVVGSFVKTRFLVSTAVDLVPGYTLRGRPRWATAIAQVTARNSNTQLVANIIAPSLTQAVNFPADINGNPQMIPAGQWGLTLTAVKGLNHLEGLMVTAVSDGAVQSPKKVANGTIALDTPGWEVTAGLRYTAIMITMPIDPGPQPVVGQGRWVRAASAVVRFLNSIGGKFASVPERDEEAPRWDWLAVYKQGQAAPSAPPTAFTGDRLVMAAGEWQRRAELAIVQAEPLPLNIQLAIEHVYAPFVQP